MAVTVIGNKLQVEVLADESTKTQLNEIKQEVIDLENANMFKDVNYNNINGVLTFTRYDDTTKAIDLQLELLVESGYYDEVTNELVLVLANGSEIKIPVANLLTDLDAHNIRFNGSGTNYLVNKLDVEGAVKELDTRVKTNADKLDEIQEKTKFLIHGKNYINPNNIRRGDVVSDSGVIFTDEGATHDRTGYIDITGSTSLVFGVFSSNYTPPLSVATSNYVLRGAFYDTNKNFLASVPLNAVVADTNKYIITVPENAHYIVLAVNRIDGWVWQLEDGAIGTPYEEYKILLDKGGYLTDIPELSITNSKIENNAVTNPKIANKSVSRSKLDDYPLTGSNLISGTDLNTLIVEGRYLGLSTSTHDNLPSDFVGKSFMLDVKVYGTTGGFYLQEITELYNAQNKKVRYIQGTNAWEWTTVTSSRFSGKTIVCLGDSITEGSGSAYPNFISQKLGANVINGGFGGTHMSKHVDTTAGQLYDEMCMYKIANAINTGDFTAMEQAAISLNNDYSDNNIHIVNRLKELNWNEVDYITVFYGANDFGNSSTDIGEDTDTDGTTFKGAINYSIEKILTKYPHIKLVFIAPMWRARILNGDGKDVDTNPNSKGLYMKEFTDATIEVCKLNKIPVFDMYRESGINKYNHTTFLRDGLHPNLAGDEHLANKICGFLESQF